MPTKLSQNAAEHSRMRRNRLEGTGKHRNMREMHWNRSDRNEKMKCYLAATLVLETNVLWIDVKELDTFHTAATHVTHSTPLKHM